jgi:hypothetical protein
MQDTPSNFSGEQGSTQTPKEQERLHLNMSEKLEEMSTQASEKTK